MFDDYDGSPLTNVITLTLRTSTGATFTVQENCNSTGDAGSDTCMDYNDCLNPCTNLSGQARTACIQTCDTGHPSGKAIFDAMDTCLVNNCNAECP